jgi:hypothetical protein
MRNRGIPGESRETPMHRMLLNLHGRLQEVFVPGFPHCLFAGAPDAQWVLKYQKNSIVLGSPQYNKIRQAVKRANIWYVYGTGKL